MGKNSNFSPHLFSYFTFDHDAVFYGVALLLWDAGSSDMSGTRKRAASMSAIGAATVIARTLLNAPK
jgi:succinate dehydrogenase/fumarate reductase cytochrome b subunit